MSNFLPNELWMKVFLKLVKNKKSKILYNICQVSSLFYQLFKVPYIQKDLKKTFLGEPREMSDINNMFEKKVEWQWLCPSQPLEYIQKKEKLLTLYAQYYEHLCLLNNDEFDILNKLKVKLADKVDNIFFQLKYIYSPFRAAKIGDLEGVFYYLTKVGNNYVFIAIIREKEGKIEIVAEVDSFFTFKESNYSNNVFVPIKLSDKEKENIFKLTGWCYKGNLQVMPILGTDKFYYDKKWNFIIAKERNEARVIGRICGKVFRKRLFKSELEQVFRMGLKYDPYVEFPTSFLYKFLK